MRKLRPFRCGAALALSTTAVAMGAGCCAGHKTPSTPLRGKDRPQTTHRFERGALDVQGHRGCRGLLPENTLPAFEEALRLGVTTLELDLQVTRDRVLVAYHDQRLDPRRCVRDDGSPLAATRVKDLDYADLTDVDCGSLPHPLFPTQRRVFGSRIPRFSDVLELARRASYPVRLNAEIKMQRPQDSIPLEEFAALVVDEIQRHGLEQRVTIQSFQPQALVAVRALAPAVRLAVLVPDRVDYDRLLDESGANILSPDYRGLRRRDVRRAHARGVAVVPWTVNERRDIRTMIRWGVDGIISDYPDRVLEILRASAGRAATPAPGSTCSCSQTAGSPSWPRWFEIGSSPPPGRPLPFLTGSQWAHSLQVVGTNS